MESPRNHYMPLICSPPRSKKFFTEALRDLTIRHVVSSGLLHPMGPTCVRHHARKCKQHLTFADFGV